MLCRNDLREWRNAPANGFELLLANALDHLVVYAKWFVKTVRTECQYGTGNRGMKGNAFWSGNPA